MSHSGNVRTTRGLFPDEEVGYMLQGYPTELVFYLRRGLASHFPKLREKLNTNSRYLGYANGCTDALYVYVHKRWLRLDIHLPQARAAELQRRGFEVRPAKNFQWAAGWLTGWRVPLDTGKRDLVLALAIEALIG